MVQRELAVIEFMEVHPSWEDFAPWVAALNEIEFCMLKWYLRNPFDPFNNNNKPKDLHKHENPLARQLADVEFGDLDEEYGHLIEKHSREDAAEWERRVKAREGKGMREEESRAENVEVEKKRLAEKFIYQEVDDGQELDEQDDNTFTEPNTPTPAPRAKSRAKTTSKSAARQARSDWGQERSMMTEDEIRIVQPDYDTIGRPSHGRMGRHKAFLPGGEGDRKGVGMVELTDVEFRNLVRHRIANKIHVPKLRPREDPSEQASWDIAARKRNEKLEGALDAARKKLGVSKEEREALLEDWEGEIVFPGREEEERFKSITALGREALASRR